MAEWREAFEEGSSVSDVFIICDSKYFSFFLLACKRNDSGYYVLNMLKALQAPAMFSSPVTPSTLASSSTPPAMSSSSVTQRTLGSSPSLSSLSSPSVTPATKPPECSNYKILNDSSIATTYRLDGLSVDPCKGDFNPGWHRFEGEAGNQMADTCVNMCHCGKRYPGWLTGDTPPWRMVLSCARFVSWDITDAVINLFTSVFATAVDFTFII
ncbi:pancreatic secretory granule membrane major glycoprotein GP2-like [Montipora capricornis]|uniref:pancreatic secretory granule membrane major glycoprotein GP2-like n=1 Tax=Montipora capricornis TaxID=246305 RepID=UPI0035F14775